MRIGLLNARKIYKLQTPLLSNMRRELLRDRLASHTKFVLHLYLFVALASQCIKGGWSVGHSCRICKRYCAVVLLLYRASRVGNTGK